MADDTPPVERGHVNAYDTFKGFGFIRRAKGRDVFFFYDDIEGENKDLTIGDVVTFTIKALPKGPRAFAIKKLNEY